MNANGLVAALKGLAGRSTADLVGIAPGGAFSAEELGELGQAFGPVRAVVVLAQRIVDPVQTVRFLSGDTYDESAISTSFGDAMLRNACWRVVQMLERAGYRAAIPRNLRYGDDGPRHQLSYKKAGVLAGLGAFGRNQLLIHPEWGPWMWLRTVVTEASLTADAPIDFSPCEGCAQCLAVCPAGALSEAGIERERCRTAAGYADPARGAVHFSPHGRVNCEECMRACPVGTAPARLEMGGAA